MFTLVVLTCMLNGFSTCTVSAPPTVITVPGFVTEELCLTAGNELSQSLERERLEVIVSRCVRVRR